jgi:HAD superfamily hydrolase (TIGR01509 family)
MIKTILFDADGVLQLPAGDLEERIEMHLGKPRDVMAFMNDIFEVETPPQIGVGNFRAAMPYVLKKWYPSRTIDEFLAMWLCVDVCPEIMEIVAALRAQGIFCAIASTQEETRARFMSETVGYARMFDHEYYSYALGVTKPDIRYFQAILAHGKFDPATTLFIDDREENVAAAIEAGMHARHFYLEKIGEGGAPMRALLAEFGLDV